MTETDRKKRTHEIISEVTGLKLIGTCGADNPCEHWDNPELKDFGFCSNPIMNQVGMPFVKYIRLYLGHQLSFAKDFGCVHWKAKENPDEK